MSMTGKEKIMAAFSKAGTPEIAAVMPYEELYIRDHWDEVTSHPWWYGQEVNLERQFAWRKEYYTKTGLDWITLPYCASREERENYGVEQRDDGQVYLVDWATGMERPLAKPAVSGITYSTATAMVKPRPAPETPDEVDQIVGQPLEDAVEQAVIAGRGDLAEKLLGDFGAQLFSLHHVSSPLWCCYDLWGFEGMMTKLLEQPELVRHACERFLAWAASSVRQSARFGVMGIWIEECMTDMIGPDEFGRLNVPYMRRLVDEIRATGMKSIYYFCGNPEGKWEHLLEVGADALALEEGKKGFEIEIEAVLERVNGQCAVLGNLDAVGVLQEGGEADLQREIQRQIQAARAHGSRFIMSLGSPATPETPVARLQRYRELVHELG